MALARLRSTADTCRMRSPERLISRVVLRAIPEVRMVSWWALQESNLRPLPCESERGSRHLHQPWQAIAITGVAIGCRIRRLARFGTVFPPPGSKLGPTLELK